jgi:hypothetical protein
VSVVAKVKFIAGLIFFLLVLSTGWQIASCELANIELKDELHDVAAMGGSEIGLLAGASDDDLRDAVIRRAAEHSIRLRREQIVVRRGGTEKRHTIFLSTKYKTRVSLPGMSLIIHFSATSE